MQAPFWLSDDPQAFPETSLALEEPDGLLAVGGDLSPDRLMAAYSQGIFPWYSDDQPILWWSPNPRTLLFFDDFHVSKSLQKIIKKADYQVTFDKHFEAVIDACQKPRTSQDGTWITEDMKRAYLQLFNLGIAHCVAIHKDETLIGGLYGVSLGKAFFGESMFSAQDNGSKLALYHLIEKLQSWGFSWLDCQVWSEHLGRLGSKTVPRETFLEYLNKALTYPTKKGPW